MSTWNANYDSFRESVIAGYKYQLIVAQQFLMHGYWAKVPTIRIRERNEKIVPGEFYDQEDLYVCHRPGGMLKLEIKSYSDRHDPFTCPDDFPYRKAILCSRKAWPHKSQVDALLMICQATEKIIVAHHSVFQYTFDFGPKFDRLHNCMEMFTAIMPEHLITFGQYIAMLQATYGPPP